MTESNIAITGIVVGALSWSYLRTIMHGPEMWAIVGLFITLSVLAWHVSPLPNHNNGLFQSEDTLYDNWGWK